MYAKWNTLFQGTGKTRTIVATIEEILSSSLGSSNDFILVNVNSNAACDEIAQRLLQLVEPHTIFRMYAKSYNDTKVNINIKKCYNYYQGEFKYPSLRYLYGFKVVICTLSTAGHLMRARSKDPDFDPYHFTYLFIDECASASETAAIIPIAGTCTA